jgi:hypothetical protein
MGPFRGDSATPTALDASRVLLGIFVALDGCTSTLKALASKKYVVGHNWRPVGCPYRQVAVTCGALCFILGLARTSGSQLTIIKARGLEVQVVSLN